MKYETNLKLRCRLCYTRLRDPVTLLHKKFSSFQSAHRTVNIFKHRPESYHDFIVRYLFINLSENKNSEQYSHLICGSCADSLDQLHRASQIVEKTQKNLRNKYRKTCRIVRSQIGREQVQRSSIKVDQPKRQSKRKGAPKHIDQTKTNLNRCQPYVVRVNDEILSETTNHGKVFQGSPKPNVESYGCVNLLKSPIVEDRTNSTTPIVAPPHKGNQIERIVASLLSGTENQSDFHQAQRNGDSQPEQTANKRRKIASNNDVLPSFMENDDEQVSIGGNSDESSSSALQTVKPSASSISTSSTSDGLAITAINQTGQKQVFMAKQIGNMKKYQCSLCEKVVTNIQIHVRRHTNDKPYPCKYCEKRFTNSGDLQIHVRIHTGEKPYACPICLKSYRTIGNFNSHVKTHDSGIRPHRCEICHQTFPIPKDWYSHLRSSHRSRIPSSSSPSLAKTVTQAVLPNGLSSQQQNSETIVASKVKLEPINRSQLIIKASTSDDDQEPVNMSKKEIDNELDDDDEDLDDEDDDDDGEQEDQSRTTKNLLKTISSSNGVVQV